MDYVRPIYAYQEQPLLPLSSAFCPLTFQQYWCPLPPMESLYQTVQRKVLQKTPIFSRRLFGPLQPTSVRKMLANPNGASRQLPSRPAPQSEPTRPRPRRKAKGEPNTSAFYLFHHSPLEGLSQYRTSQWLLILVSCSISFIVRRPRI